MLLKFHPLLELLLNVLLFFWLLLLYSYLQIFLGSAQLQFLWLIYFIRFCLGKISTTLILTLISVLFFTQMFNLMFLRLSILRLLCLLYFFYINLNRTIILLLMLYLIAFSFAIWFRIWSFFYEVFHYFTPTLFCLYSRPKTLLFYFSCIDIISCHKSLTPSLCIDLSLLLSILLSFLSYNLHLHMF